MRTLAMLLLLGCLGATAEADVLQRKAVVSAGGSHATGGTYTLSANLGDILVGPSSDGATEIWHGFWAPLADDAVGVPDPRVPLVHFLGRPMPNPSRGSTIVIEFGRPATETVSLRIYDLFGRRVRELARGERGPGVDRAVWDLRTDSGERVATGVYFSRLTSGPFAAVRKIVVLD